MLGQVKSWQSTLATLLINKRCRPTLYRNGVIYWVKGSVHVLLWYLHSLPFLHLTLLNHARVTFSFLFSLVQSVQLFLSSPRAECHENRVSSASRVNRVSQVVMLTRVIFLTWLLVSESIFEPNIHVSSSQLKLNSTRIRNLFRVEDIANPTRKSGNLNKNQWNQ